MKVGARQLRSAVGARSPVAEAVAPPENRQGQRAAAGGSAGVDDEESEDDASQVYLLELSIFSHM